MQRCALHGDDPVAVQPLIDRLRGEQRVVRAVRPVRESLEDLFMRAVEHVDSPGATERKP